MVKLNILDEVQNKALSLMEEKLRYVTRFRGNKHIVTNNTVRDHIHSLLTLTDKVFKNIDLDPNTATLGMIEMRESIRLAAVLHDMGELLGEVSTLEEVISKDAVRDGLKKEFEFKVFRVFTRLAIKSIRQDRPEIFELAYQAMIDDITFPLKLTKKLVSRLDSILAITDLESQCDYAYTTLERYYYQVEHAENLGILIFKLLDKLDGNNYFINNAVLKDQLSNGKFDSVLNMNTSIMKQIEQNEEYIEWKEIYEPLISNLRSELNITMTNYKTLCNQQKRILAK